MNINIYFRKYIVVILLYCCSGLCNIIPYVVLFIVQYQQYHDIYYIILHTSLIKYIDIYCNILVKY